MSKQLIRDYISALKNLYGIVSKEKVVEIYNIQNEEIINIDQLNDSIDDDFLDKTFAYNVDNHIIDDYLEFEDIKYFLSQQFNKPYYVPKKKELLKYKDSNYFEKTAYYRNLLTFVRKEMKINPQLAREICEDIVLSVSMETGSFDGVFFEFERRQIQFRSEEQLIKMVDLVVELSNNNRLQENRGHTPKELSKLHETPNIIIN